MTLRISLIAAAACALLGLVAVAISASAADAKKPVYWFEDTSQPGGNVVPGAYSTLNRFDSGISMNYHTTGLRDGHAYTVWWVIFNNRGACTAAGGGCSNDDVERAIMGISNAPGVGVHYAAGHVIGTKWSGAFGGQLKSNDISGCVKVPPLSLVCNPLTNPTGAEVHLVLHDHGPPIPGKVNEQISTFEGGCKSFINGATGAVNIEYNLGTYACFSPQASPHVP